MHVSPFQIYVEKDGFVSNMDAFFHVFMSQCFHASSLSIMWNISPVFKFACEAEDSNMEGKLGNTVMRFHLELDDRFPYYVKAQFISDQSNKYYSHFWPI